MGKRFKYILLSLFLISLSKELEDQTNIKPPGFSRVSGFYPQNFKLKLSSEENTTIYYTLDSSDPRNSTTSKEFKDYILIYDRSLEPNLYSAINETEDSPISICRGYRYNGPKYPVDKAMIVRAVSKNSKGDFSQVINKTYFITDYDLYKYQDIITVSLVTNPENLFDPDIGIYVTGTIFQNWKNSDEFDPWLMPFDPKSKCNYYMKGSEWEREAHLTIFEKGDISVQQNIGIRVKGAATRNYPSKSFNLYARKKYGKSKIETDLLKDNFDINGNLITSYKGLTLRSVFDESRLRDKFGSDLFDSRKEITSTKMEACALFLNGEYWGLYFLQEKISDDFIENNYLIPSDNIALAKDNQIEDGPEEESIKFQEFCEEYSKKDVSDQKTYNEIKNFMDIDSLIELYATGIYIANGDWPGKNDGEWRNIGEKIEGNKFSDGKWRFIIYDLDYSMGVRFRESGPFDFDSFTYVQSRIERAPINAFFLNLLKNNKEFKNKFVNVYCDYANEIYHISKINKLVEKYRDEYTELVANSELRWWGWNFDNKIEGYANYRSRFLKSLDDMLNFFEQRPKFTLPYMKDFLGLKGDIVDLNIKIKGKGKVQINTIIPEMKNGEWTGKYFSRIPINIKAIPDNGYNFKGWSGYIDSIQQNEEVILLESQTIFANFD